MGINKKYNFHFWAMAALGKGISGSDRIFIEFARRWSGRYPVTIYVWQEGYQMCQRQHLKTSKIKYQISKMEPWKNFGFVVNYFARVVESIRIAISLKLVNEPSTITYSASEFWMDSLPAFILKLRFPKITWAAAWYQTAPKPWVGFSKGERVTTYKLSAFLYWFVQQPIKPLISRFADFVLVNNEEEKKQFPKHNREKRAIVVLGAVDLSVIEKWKLKIKNLLKVYDAVFQGRFHPQKGVVELIDIWKKVVAKKPDAKLAMIGDGPLMENVKLKIKNEKLEKNIQLFGYVFDGSEKYRIFSQSKIVVHPAFYDSGGMAAAEAMAFGLPAIGFNLKAYESYYPQGMVKVKTGDLSAFAKKIWELLENKDYQEKIGKEALEMIEANWSWDKRAEEIFSKII
jgi:glycosyltransferase involved in cell wall biosynthesis